MTSLTNRWFQLVSVPQWWPNQDPLNVAQSAKSWRLSDGKSGVDAHWKSVPDATCRTANFTAGRSFSSLELCGFRLLTNQASCRSDSAFLIQLAEKGNRLDSRSERFLGGKLLFSDVCFSVPVRWARFAGVSRFVRHCAIDFAALLAASALILFVCLTRLRVTSAHLTTISGVSCCLFYPFFASFANSHDMLTGLIW
jgi:hypothetical protein